MTRPGPSEVWHAEARTLTSFLLVGGTCYLLNVAILAFAVEVLGLQYVLANLLSLAILVVVGHYLNRRQTFRSRGRYLPELSRFALTITVQTASALGLIYLLVEHAGLHYLAANFAVTAVFTLLSFLAQREFVFRRADNRAHGSQR